MASGQQPEQALSGSEKAQETAFITGYLPYLLAHASHLVSGGFHDYLRGRGIQVPSWRVLATLSDGDGMTVGELARIGLYNQPTATKIVDRLAGDGLVERRQDRQDRRKTLLFITPKGRALVDGLLSAARTHEADVTANFSVEELALLKRALRTLIERLDPSAD